MKIIIIMNKFIADTLMIRGKYSMKRVLIAFSFPIAMSIGVYIVISDRLLGLKTVNIYAIQVFTALLGFILVLAGINVWAKKQELKTLENIITNDTEEVK